MSRSRVSTGFTTAILLGLAWWLGKAIGQHRRARRQMGVEPVLYTVPVRPTPLEMIRADHHHRVRAA